MQGVRKGKQCNNKATGDYCEKHQEHYTLVEIAKARNMNICGKGTRCSELIPIYKLFCDACTEKRRVLEQARYATRILDVTRCYDCGTVPEEFAVSLRGLTSRYCKDCYSKMRTVEKYRDRSIENESIHNPEIYFNKYKYDAARRGLLFELSYSEFMSIVARACYYCEEIKELSYNGVDRQNNEIGYNVANCVPACSMCNLMKSSHTADTFIEHCKAIAEFQTKGVTSHLHLVWDGNNATGFEDYKRDVLLRRKLEFTIDGVMYNTLKNSQCYLCGQLPATGSFNGIDRIDSDIGYINDNVASCCVYCNRMKNNYTLEKFIAKCISIANHK